MIREINCFHYVRQCNLAYFTLSNFASLTWTQEFVLAPDITAEYAQKREESGGRNIYIYIISWKRMHSNLSYALPCEFPMIVNYSADVC